MCSKLLGGLLVGILGFGRSSCAKRQDVITLGEGSFISQELIAVRSLSELETTLDVVNRKDIVTQEGVRFAFFEYYPYRGVPHADGVYCYEQVQDDVWILRGFFPVITWDFRSLSNRCYLEYQVATNGEVNLIANSNVLFRIRSRKAVSP